MSGRPATRPRIDHSVVNIWEREVGLLPNRSFSNRFSASQDLLQRLGLDKRLRKHKGCVNTITFNADGDIILSGSDDRQLILWHWEAAAPLKLSFDSGHSDNIFQAKFMPFSDDRSIVTSAADGQVRFSQILECGKVETCMLGKHQGQVHSLAVEPGNPFTFYTCGEDGVVKHFDLRTRVATNLFTCKEAKYNLIVYLNAIAVDPRNPGLFAVGGMDEYARLYDIRSYRSEAWYNYARPVDHFCPRHLIGTAHVGITGLAFSDQSELLASYSGDFIYLFTPDMGLGPNQSSTKESKTKTKTPPQVYKGHKNGETVKGVNFFGPKCEYVVSGSDCGRVFIWRKKDGELLRAMEADKHVVNCVESHPHMPFLSSSGIDSDIKIWTPGGTQILAAKLDSMSVFSDEDDDDSDSDSNEVSDEISDDDDSAEEEEDNGEDDVEIKDDDVHREQKNQLCLKIRNFHLANILHTPVLFAQERSLHEKWTFLRGIEESYFKQKSRINWLKEGDQNTTYFQRIAQTRASYNSIRSFLLSNGETIQDPIEMSFHAINHFKTILGPSVLPPTSLLSPPSWFQSLSPFRCPPEIQLGMVARPSPEEIKKVLFRLNPNKSSGPDGLTSGFYKAAWDILGPEVTASISDFFTNSFMPASTNATILTLIPKHPGASMITDYRPISCLNTLYKVVSRLLVRRLKPLLPSLILPNQTAFVKDRLLVENTVLAAEIVNGYHKTKGPKRITIKVDIAKAFDSVSWEFLFNCLEGLELPEQYRKWLKACICTTNFTVGYNGMVQGYFKGKRGLRQGDPLSPYLFVIAMNCLSLMLNKAAGDKKFTYHKGCAGSKLTHLCFADDLLIFAEGTLESVQNVLQVLHKFQKRSGLAVSVQKSSFFAAGVSEADCDLIKFSTGMPQGTLPVRYLGVPLCSKKLSMANCEILIQQVKMRLTSWSSKSLSFAGRLLLIKTVIAGISTFWCSSFVLPKACIKRINSLCSIFLWQGNLEAHHSARVSWDTVTKTKEAGGLGIRDLVVWNKACCLKLIWLIFFQSGSVWVAWFRTEILQGNLSNFWTVKPNQRNSWLINKLLKIREEIYLWIKLRVGNGRNCRFWSDNWSPFGNIHNYLLGNEGSRLGIPLKATLASLHRRDEWRLPPARSDRLVSIQAHLTTISITNQEDYYEWEIEGQVSKKFGTGEVYRQLRGEMATVPWTKAVWCGGGIPRHSFLTWLFTLNRCPTRDRILGWGLQTDPVCLLCNVEPESRDHLLFRCEYSWRIWRPLARRCNLQPLRSWNTSLQQMQSLTLGKLWKKLALITWQATIYWIWAERKGRLHRGVFSSDCSISSSIDRQIRNRIASFRDTNPLHASKLLQLWLSTGSQSADFSI
ncbi:unnamed protein product [Microthlaspi erraticum]|uniref:Reverse transcriptase domain-containing protein n=1 Tax=Microthlaspi erraticum TaxID=1685480 RepID=A0A6D2I5R5_9BRAS|nr:unnamed protein product [Microthlaspi erraticum]